MEKKQHKQLVERVERAKKTVGEMVDLLAQIISDKTTVIWEVAQLENRSGQSSNSQGESIEEAFLTGEVLRQAKAVDELLGVVWQMLIYIETRGHVEK